MFFCFCLGYFDIYHLCEMFFFSYGCKVFMHFIILKHRPPKSPKPFLDFNLMLAYFLFLRSLQEGLNEREELTRIIDHSLYHLQSI